ncbi:hypothetical protein DL96DRAFT_1594763 [Flagelloscypha sp. PMI_526]|nr:hypothetical protein DL96DRAFT_1594763 [Flagelloscypha sp. PMI_526]
MQSEGIEPLDGSNGKEKKRRNRQRLSCTECTKRRQKCDRQRPCGLCTSRGVTHLCRWESDYVKPPTGTDLLGTIDRLKSRVIMLEEALHQQSNSTMSQSSPNPGYPSPTSNIATPTASPSLSQVRTVASLLSQATPGVHTQAPTPLPPNVKEDSCAQSDNIYAAAVNLAKASVVSGAGEYVGQGTIVCSMLKMCEGDVKLPYAQSTSLYSMQPPHAQSLAINSLLQRLPPRAECEPALSAFFTHHNWRFGVPEVIFQKNWEMMWQIIAVHDNIQVNPHWLGLLYSCLSFSTTDPVRGPEYFYNAVTARRIAEDMLLSPAFTPNGERKPSTSADGVALGCFAAVLQANYLADRGMVSEGWKIVGNAIRAGTSLTAYHYTAWTSFTDMTNDEKLLRRRAWWAMIVFDRLNSFILGRPSSMTAEQFDIHPPDWSRLGHCSYGMFEEALVKLCSVVDEVHRKCLGPDVPTPELVAEMDEKLAQWETDLQTPFRWRLAATPEDLRSWGSNFSRPELFDAPRNLRESDPSSASNEFTILRQRHALATWFPFLPKCLSIGQFIAPYGRVGGVCARNIRGDPHGMEPTNQYWKESERLRLRPPPRIVETTTSRKVMHGKISGFMDSFFLLDCSVGLMLCLCSFAPGDYQQGNILGRLARSTPNDPQGDISRKSIAVLLVLKRYQEHLMKGVGKSLRTSKDSTKPAAPQTHAYALPSVQQSNGNSQPASTSYERYSRYLDTTALPSTSSSSTAMGLDAAPASATSSTPSSSSATGSPQQLFDLPDFSFLNSFSFLEDPASVFREFASPHFDWGADWNSLTTS